MGEALAFLGIALTWVVVGAGILLAVLCVALFFVVLIRTAVRVALGKRPCP